MRKIKKVYKFLLFLSMICSLTACWDQEELEDKSYVIGLGIDSSKDEEKIKVTMLLANPEVGSMQGGGGSIESPREIVTFDANDFIAAKATANAVVSRSISYDLLRVIIVSEDFAKDKDFITTLYDVLKDKQIRLSSYLAISKEEANKYFRKNRPKMETRPHKYFQFMIDHGIENGLIPDSTLFRFFKSLERGSDLATVMYTSAERQENPKLKREDEYMAGQLNVSGELDDTQFIGAAVFKEGVMIGQLNGQQTRVVNILDDTTNIKDILVNIPDPFSNSKKQLSARVMKTENNKVKMDLKGSKPKIFITIPLKVEIMSNPSMTDFAKKKNQQIIKKQIAEHFQKMNENLFAKSQKEFKGAPYPLSFYSRKYFSTNQEYKRFNWPKSFLYADIIVKANIEIIDYGKQTKKPMKMGD
jgi:spore germination protein KC